METFKHFYDNLTQLNEDYKWWLSVAAKLPEPQCIEYTSLIKKHKDLVKDDKIKDLTDKNIDKVLKGYNWDNLKAVLNKFSDDALKTKPTIKTDTKVWSNQIYTVYKPRNAFDCDKLAHGQTRWCVASGDLNECKLNWKKYVTSANATFYIAIADKNIKLPDEDQRLLAIIKHVNGEVEILDRENTEVFPDESLLTEDELQEIVKL